MKEYLDKLLVKGEIPNSFLFVASLISNMEAVLYEFVDRLLDKKEKVHPDLYHFYPEGKLGVLSVESLRTLKEEVYLPPYQAKRRVFILHEADRMNLVSANALLKCFEEPLPTSFIILLTAHPERILPTIRSRCQTLYFQAEKKPQENMIFLVPLLSNLATTAVPFIFEKLQEISTQIEKSSAVELEATDHEISAAQKLSREKEKEGKEAIQESQYFEALLHAILGWYRDLELLRINGKKEYLMHPSSLTELKERIETGIFPTLDLIAKAVEQARRSYERSTPLKNVLETLFIQLKQLERGEEIDCKIG